MFGSLCRRCMRAKRHGGTRDHISEIGTTHITPGNRKIGRDGVPAWPADLDVVPGCDDPLEQWPAECKLAGPDKAHLTPEGFTWGARAVDVRIDPLGEEVHVGEALRLPHRHLCSGGEVVRIDEAREVHHPRLWGGVEEPECGAVPGEQVSESIRTQSYRMSGDQEQVRIESLDLPLDEGTTDHPELPVAPQHIEHLRCQAEPTTGSSDRVLGAVGGPGTEDRETSNGQKEMPASKKIARFLLVIELSLSLIASVRPRV